MLNRIKTKARELIPFLKTHKCAWKGFEAIENVESAPQSALKATEKWLDVLIANEIATIKKLEVHVNLEDYERKGMISFPEAVKLRKAIASLRYKVVNAPSLLRRVKKCSNG